MIMMKIGDYAFSVNRAAYQSFERSTAYAWAAQERMGREAALQFVGVGEDAVTLTGVVFSGGPAQAEKMRQEAAQGKPLLFVDGTGKIHGLWVIVSVGETGSVFFADGVARKTEFTLKLRYYGET
ncbi:phage tail protein [Desulfobaculum bizertense]|uniref:phage tail protein n=1 Tax=Desulfobaculum bizertense TaxID=376490 RepID=UPI001F307F59|nr:phage tail protein [Desulfobaculum bizertense]UIJ38530.1 phage tail protein [Desulfobaculum bizertense]